MKLWVESFQDRSSATTREGREQALKSVETLCENVIDLITPRLCVMLTQGRSERLSMTQSETSKNHFANSF